MNKTYKYTLTAHEKKEISFDTGVARLAVTNGDGVDGSTTVVMSEITKQHSGDLVSFIDGGDAPFADFIVNIVAIQSGSGDPSPENVRPITGWTDATINVSGEDTSNPTTYNVNWQSTAGTVYGGTLDVKNGLLTQTWKSVIYDGSEDENWQVQTLAGFCIDVDKKVGKGNYLADNYAASNGNCWDIYATPVGTFSGHPTLARLYFRYPYEGFAADLTAWRTWLASNNVHVIYELATPVTYQLTPTEVRSLLGVNNVWADCGPVDVRYFVQSTQPMIDYIDDKTENVVEVFKATANGGDVYTLDDITCDELCLYARTHSNIVLKVARYNSTIAYDIFILSDYIGTSAVFRHTMITSAIGGGYVLYVRELQADSTTATNVLTIRNVNITADT